MPQLAPSKAAASAFARRRDNSRMRASSAAPTSPPDTKRSLSEGPSCIAFHHTASETTRYREQDSKLKNDKKRQYLMSQAHMVRQNTSPTNPFVYDLLRQQQHYNRRQTENRKYTSGISSLGPWNTYKRVELKKEHQLLNYNVC